MAELTAIERATSAAREYGAAWGDALHAVEDGTSAEAAAVHMRRAGDHLVALVEGLTALHEQLDAGQVLAAGDVEGYAGDDLARIVRAATAFRRAAPTYKWPHQAWGEMAELCAAVDRKPGPQ